MANIRKLEINDVIVENPAHMLGEEYKDLVRWIHEDNGKEYVVWEKGEFKKYMLVKNAGGGLFFINLLTNEIKEYPNYGGNRDSIICTENNIYLVDPGHDYIIHKITEFGTRTIYTDPIIARGTQTIAWIYPLRYGLMYATSEGTYYYDESESTHTKISNINESNVGNIISGIQRSPSVNGVFGIEVGASFNNTLKFYDRWGRWHTIKTVQGQTNGYGVCSGIDENGEAFDVIVTNMGSNHGGTTTYNYVAYKSTDSGESWDEIEFSSAAERGVYPKLVYHDGYFYAYFSNNHNIRKSKNLRTWEVIPTGFTIEPYNFDKSVKGVYVGSSGSRIDYHTFIFNGLYGNNNIAYVDNDEDGIVPTLDLPFGYYSYGQNVFFDLEFKHDNQKNLAFSGMQAGTFERGD